MHDLVRFWRGVIRKGEAVGVTVNLTAKTESSQLDCRRAVVGGKDPSQLQYGKLIYASVDDNPDSAYDAMGNFLRGYYGDRADVRRMSAVGTPEQVATHLRKFAGPELTKALGDITELDIADYEYDWALNAR